MKIQGKKFLVIGGAGLIGSHVVEQLLAADAKEVTVFDNFSRGTRENLEIALKDERCSIYPLGGEIMHPEFLRDAMKDVDGVFHLAALWLLHCQEFETSAFKVNIEGTFNVVQAILATNVKRLVYSSSASVYGDAVTEPMKEDHPYNNTNFYGATKIAGEHICRSLYNRHKEGIRKFDYVGMRYMNVYGPRQDYRGAYIAVIMKILDRLDQGLPPIIYGDGSQSYDFIHVRDCALANICAMESNSTDRFYNVGTGVKTSIKQLTEIILELTESDQKIQFEESGPTFVKNRVGCPKNAQEEINFTAKMDLRKGIQELIEWRNSHKQEVSLRRKLAGVA